MKALQIFWKFTRPHTILGSAISIAVLYILSANNLDFSSPYFLLSFLAALATNVFITGYNQLVDVDLDRINKPGLPLASGEITRDTARAIVVLSLAIALVAAGTLGFYFLGLIGLICAVGFLYSWKKVYLKKNHGLAATAITLVRGLLVNIGFYFHFAKVDVALDAVPAEIWLLAVFVSLFSLGISWFKDIPDRDGDRGLAIKSLVLTYGISRTYTAGVATVATGYFICAALPAIITMHGLNNGVLSILSCLGGFAFLFLAARTKPENQRDIKRFYRFFWALFVFQYAIFAAAALLG
ncbi:MAG: homogentisate phytyltransferase [Cryomorphaceae bacterium]|nr:homogentisate phytyltransferase [Flavobacteriales bacterium]